MEVARATEVKRASDVVVKQEPEEEAKLVIDVSDDESNKHVTTTNTSEAPNSAVRQWTDEYLEEFSRAVMLYPSLLRRPYVGEELVELAERLALTQRTAVYRLSTFRRKYEYALHHLPRPEWALRVQRVTQLTHNEQRLLRAFGTRRLHGAGSWARLVGAARAVLHALAAEGDAEERLARDMRLNALEWRLLEAVALYDDRLDPLPAIVWSRAEGRRLVRALLVSAGRAGAESAAPAWKGRRAALSARRWHALKETARGALAQFLKGGAAPAPELVQLLESYPHVATWPLPAWRDVVAGDALLALERSLAAAMTADPIREKKRPAPAGAPHREVKKRKLPTKGERDPKLAMEPVVALVPLKLPAEGAPTLRERIKFESPVEHPAPPGPPPDQRLEGEQGTPAVDGYELPPAVPPEWCVSVEQLRRALQRAARPAAPAPPPCCAARRLRNAAEESGLPPSERCAACGVLCRCCCRALLGRGVAYNLMRRVRSELRQPARRPPPPPASSPPPLDPLSEWNRQKSITARFFDLNLKRPPPAAARPAPAPGPVLVSSSPPGGAAPDPAPGPGEARRVMVVPPLNSDGAPGAAPPSAEAVSGATALMELLRAKAAPPAAPRAPPFCSLELNFGPAATPRVEFCALPLPEPAERAALSPAQWAAARAGAPPCVVRVRRGAWGPRAHCWLVAAGAGAGAGGGAGGRLYAAGDAALGLVRLSAALPGARELVAVAGAGEARALLLRGAALQVLCRASGALLPLLAERAAPALVALRCADFSLAQDLAQALNAEK